MTTKPTTKQLVDKFISEATEAGFTFGVTCSVVTIYRTFPDYDKEAYAQCDMMASSVLDCIPSKGGSRWGTDGASIGGAIALQTGKFRMSQSGCSKRFVAELLKR